MVPMVLYRGRFRLYRARFSVYRVPSALYRGGIGVYRPLVSLYPLIFEGRGKGEGNSRERTRRSLLWAGGEAGRLPRFASLHGPRHTLAQLGHLRSLRSLYACSGLFFGGVPRGVPRPSTEGRTEPASGSESKGGGSRTHKA